VKNEDIIYPLFVLSCENVIFLYVKSVVTRV